MNLKKESFLIFETGGSILHANTCIYILAKQYIQNKVYE